MTPSQRRRRFAAEIRRQLRARHKQVNEAAVRVLATLRVLQEDTRAVIAAQPSEFEAARMPQLLAEIDRAIERWTRRAVAEADVGLEGAFSIGADMVTAPLAAAGAPIGSTLLSPAMLEEIQRFTADKITAIGAAAREKIESTVSATLLGGASPHEAMSAIGTSLKKPGPFKSIHYRAEVVFRTEAGRLHSMSGFARLREAARLVPGLRKEWLWSGKARATHAAANGQVREIEEPFIIAGEPLMYPRDPDGTPENTILCGCEAVPHKADW